MAAGIPIVPIVIRNAEVIAARDSSTFNPGTVDVAVHPAIKTGDWTLDDLPDRITEIRQLYLDTLKAWPRDALPDLPLYDRHKAPAKKSTHMKVVDDQGPAENAPAEKTAAKKAPGKQVAVEKVTKNIPAKKATDIAKKAATPRTTTATGWRRSDG